MTSSKEATSRITFFKKAIRDDVDHGGARFDTGTGDLAAATCRRLIHHSTSAATEAESDAAASVAPPVSV